MKRRRIDSDERSQAFTLEGFISAIVILTAVLFALQAVVITPTTGGAVDRAAQAQEEQEVRDALHIAGESGELSELVRHWNHVDEEWRDGNAPGDPAYNNSKLAEISDFGTILDEQFVNSSGKAYNLDFVTYDEDGDRVTESIVRMGGGTGDAVVSASYTVTLHDNQSLTEWDGTDFTTTGTELYEAESDHGYPLPSTSGLSESATYNVVEVRLTVW